MRTASLLLFLCLIGLGAQTFSERDDSLSGSRTSRWPNGSAREQASFTEGVRDGICLRWHSDGTPRAEGQYASGKKVGDWRFFDESGTIDPARSGVYESDHKISALGA
ncbi:MAG: hypothetical protein OSB14_03260 [Planctomycetota bacterium]|jgi:antitoxin component YwqK of YwqJK toxin-antitoxin module|nr:hypothetical protein [Planctomycetota bacterium]